MLQIDIKTLADWIKQYAVLADLMGQDDPHLAELDILGQGMIKFLQDAGYVSTERGWVLR